MKHYSFTSTKALYIVSMLSVWAVSYAGQIDPSVRLLEPSVTAFDAKWFACGCVYGLVEPGIGVAGVVLDVFTNQAMSCVYKSYYTLNFDPEAYVESFMQRTTLTPDAQELYASHYIQARRYLRAGDVRASEEQIRLCNNLLDICIADDHNRIVTRGKKVISSSLGVCIGSIISTAVCMIAIIRPILHAHGTKIPDQKPCTMLCICEEDLD